MKKRGGKTLEQIHDDVATRPDSRVAMMRARFGRTEDGGFCFAIYSTDEEALFEFAQMVLGQIEASGGGWEHRDDNEGMVI